MLSFVPLKICRTLNDGLVGSHFSQDCCYAFFKSRHTCHLKTFASTSIQTVKVKRNRVPTNFEKNKESSEIDKVGVDSGKAFFLNFHCIKQNTDHILHFFLSMFISFYSFGLMLV